MQETNDSKWEKEKQDIQMLYQQVEQDLRLDHPKMAELIDCLERHCAKTVWAQINKSKTNSGMHLTRVDFEDINSIAKIALCELDIFENYARNDNYSWFADYCVGIYRNKALDFTGKEYTRQIKDKVAIDDQEKKEKRSKRLDILMATYDDPISELAELSPVEKLAYYYIKTVTQSKANPFHIILLCYSLILHSIETDEGYGTSDQWAWNEMTGKDMLELSREFLERFSMRIDAFQVGWGAVYVGKLKKPYVFKDKTSCPLHEAVPSDKFEKDEAKNWVSRLNDKLTVEIVQEISKYEDDNSALVKMAEKRLMEKIDRKKRKKNNRENKKK